MNKGEREIADLVKEWKDQIVGLTNDYNTAISTLAEIKKDFDKKSWFDKILPYAPTMIMGLLIVFIILTFVKYSKDLDCGISFKYVGIEIEKSCPINNN